jgi:uncharacterized protein (UPF0212 family)
MAIVAIEAKEIIQTMYKGEPTALQTKALKMAYEALDKQIPMKVKEIHVDEYFCPACGEQNNCGDICLIGDSYCPKCGQALYQEN